MSSIWTPDEERFINRIKKTPSQRQLQDVEDRCRAEMKEQMRSFIGKANTVLNQRTIQYIAKQVITKYNNELVERGFDATIKFTLQPLDPEDG